MRKLLLGIITSLLLINQSYAWNDVCIYMKFGAGFIGKVLVETLNSASEKSLYIASGGYAPVLNSSCTSLVGLEHGVKVNIIPGESLYLILVTPTGIAQCDGGYPIRQNESTGTLHVDAWGPTYDLHCAVQG